MGWGLQILEQELHLTTTVYSTPLPGLPGSVEEYLPSRPLRCPALMPSPWPSKRGTHSTWWVLRRFVHWINKKGSFKPVRELYEGLRLAHSPQKGQLELGQLVIGWASQVRSVRPPSGNRKSHRLSRKPPGNPTAPAAACPRAMPPCWSPEAYSTGRVLCTILCEQACALSMIQYGCGTLSKHGQQTVQLLPFHNGLVSLV